MPCIYTGSIFNRQNQFWENEPIICNTINTIYIYFLYLYIKHIYYIYIYFN